MSYRIPTRNGLVGEWKLDGNALDTAGTNNGTPTNVPYANTDRGYQSQTGVFNDANSIVSGGNVTLGNAFTFLVWYKFNALSGTNTLVSVNQRVGTPTDEVNLYVGGNTINVEYANSAGVSVYPNATVTHDNTWKMAAVTFASNTVSMSINGVPLTVNNPTITSKSITQPFTIGAATFASTTYYYGGNIQSVRIFNRVLSASEIRDYYLEGLRQLGGASLYPLMDGAVAYYDMRGDANDIIGGNNGTVTGATLTTDRFGNANSAYSFNGATPDRISLPTTARTNGNFTFSAWIKPSTLTPINADANIFFDWNAANRNFLINQNNSTIQFLNGNGGTLQDTAISGGTLTTNFQYLTCVRNGTTHTIYINGASVASSVQSYSGGSSGSNSLNIGANSTPVAGYGFSGVIDSPEIYNRALSASEVKALYELSSKRKLLPFS